MAKARLEEELVLRVEASSLRNQIGFQQTNGRDIRPRCPVLRPGSAVGVPDHGEELGWASGLWMIGFGFRSRSVMVPSVKDSNWAMDGTGGPAHSRDVALVGRVRGVGEECRREGKEERMGQTRNERGRSIAGLAGPRAAAISDPLGPRARSPSHGKLMTTVSPI
jgi:hypothetical protein